MPRGDEPIFPERAQKSKSLFPMVAAIGMGNGSILSTHNVSFHRCPKDGILLPFSSEKRTEIPAWPSFYKNVGLDVLLIISFQPTIRDQVVIAQQPSSTSLPAKVPYNSITCYFDGLEERRDNYVSPKTPCGCHWKEHSHLNPQGRGRHPGQPACWEHLPRHMQTRVCHGSTSRHAAATGSTHRLGSTCRYMATTAPSFQCLFGNLLFGTLAHWLHNSQWWQGWSLMRMWQLAIGKDGHRPESQLCRCCLGGKPTTMLSREFTVTRDGATKLI